MVHTHYDNLQVSRNASDEVIKGAYRYLSQKWHPDKQPPERRAEAERVMRLVNTAYEVLSDPQRRSEHDAWIAEQERQEASASGTAQERVGDAPGALSASARLEYAMAIGKGWWPTAVLGSLVFWLFLVWIVTRIDGMERLVLGYPTVTLALGVLYVIGSAQEIVKARRKELLARADDDSLRLMYDRSARRRSAALVSVGVLLAGALVAAALLQRTPPASTSSVMLDATRPESAPAAVDRAPAPRPAETQAAQAPAASPAPSMAPATRGVVASNRCDRAVTLTVAYKQGREDDWTLTQWALRGGQSGALVTSAGALAVAPEAVYWYAVSDDGEFVWRAAPQADGMAFVLADATQSERFLRAAAADDGRFSLVMRCGA